MDTPSFYTCPFLRVSVAFGEAVAALRWETKSRIPIQQVDGPPKTTHLPHSALKTPSGRTQKLLLNCIFPVAIRFLFEGGRHRPPRNVIKKGKKKVRWAEDGGGYCFIVRGQKRNGSTPIDPR